MSVLVKDMRFPNHCSDCEFSKPWGNSGTYCSRRPWKDDVKYGEGKPDWCPLGEVPNDGVVVPKDEFQYYSRAMLVAFTLRDLLVGLNSFAEVPESIKPVANAPADNESEECLKQEATE